MDGLHRYDRYCRGARGDVNSILMLRIKAKTVRNIFFAVGAGLLIFAAGYETSQARLTKGQGGLVQRFLASPGEGAVNVADFGKFWEVWRMLEKSYVDPTALDYRQMTWGATEGLAQSLGDPYTQYLPPEENKAVNEDLAGSFYGVGIELGYEDKTLAVIAPLKGTPAEAAGVQAGDLILHIKDESKGVDLDTTGMSLPEAVKNIRGERGKTVVLTLYRSGKAEPFEVSIVRGEIVVPSVEVSYIERGGKKYALLELHRFGGRTDDEWNQKVAEITRAKVDGVVLDLRNNPGGYLDGAVYVVGEFLDSGEVVKQEGRDKSQVYDVDRAGALTKTPLVVLVNKGSASASEITAGALQDHERAKIVGETTFGKGTVQEVQDLSDGSSLHVTIAKWILPSGRWIGKEGVKPDVEAKDDAETKDKDEAVDKAIETLK